MSTFLDTTILTFYISFLGVLGMIGLKSFEIRSGKRSQIFRVFDHTNFIVRAIYDKIKKVLSFWNKNSAIAIIQWIAYYILSWARRSYIWAHKKARSHPPSRKVIDMVSGRGEVRKNGGTSFFLRRISGAEEDVVK